MSLQERAYLNFVQVGYFLSIFSDFKPVDKIN